MNYRIHILFLFTCLIITQNSISFDFKRLITQEELLLIPKHLLKAGDKYVREAQAAMNSRESKALLAFYKKHTTRGYEDQLAKELTMAARVHLSDSRLLGQAELVRKTAEDVRKELRKAEIDAERKKGGLLCCVRVALRQVGLGLFLSSNFKSLNNYDSDSYDD